MNEKQRTAHSADNPYVKRTPSRIAGELIVTGDAGPGRSSSGKKIRQWHPAFFAGLQIEFEEEKDNLIFESEHQLGRKPLGIDVLIIRKDESILPQKNIGKIFRRYNIVEYKSPADYLSIDDFYKVLGYAYLFKSDTAHVDEIRIAELTVTLICHRYPVKLIRYLRESCGDAVTQREKGIYLVEGERIPIQIILTSRLSEEKNLWLKCLGNPLESARTVERLAAAYRRKRKNSLYEAVMDMIIQMNTQYFREGTDMCQALEDLFDEIMGERFKKKLENELEKEVKKALEKEVKKELEKEVKKEVMARIDLATSQAKTQAKTEGRAEGKVEGRIEATTEVILEFLKDFGDIPEELRSKILMQRDTDILGRWVKLAARTDSVESFRMAMNG